MAWWLRAQDLGPVTLVGCGFGGWVAAELSTMSPELLAGLVLVAPAGLLPKDGRILDQILVSHSEYVRAAFEDQKAYEAVYGTDLTDELLLAWDMNREMTTRVAWKPYMYNRRLPPLLAHVHVPTLVVAAESDRIMPRSCARAVRRTHAAGAPRDRRRTAVTPWTWSSRRYWPGSWPGTCPACRSGDERETCSSVTSPSSR